MYSDDRITQIKRRPPILELGHEIARRSPDDR